ncbi:hypothetical protein BX600DRAFT_514068 [Xylariales sp. PMI_506]|nr:hypothetical protein BX600DRAFT_514068 [Xylariales sp. PMI_506]
MATKRFASPNELRTIAREDLGFYTSVVVAGIYETDKPNVDLCDPKQLIGPMRHCINTHAMLSVVIKDGHTEKAYYQHVEEMEILDHIQILQLNASVDPENPDDQIMQVERILPFILSEPYSTVRPPWKIVVTKLKSSKGLANNSYSIVFSFSHALGDTINGLAFHRTFLQGLQQNSEGPIPTSSVTSAHRTLNLGIPEPYDTPARMTISWSYLFRPLLAALLPGWICTMLGLHASASTLDAGSWTGTPATWTAEDRKNPEDGTLRLVEIDGETISKIITTARRHDAKLTAVMQQIIIRALSRAIVPVADPAPTNFVSYTPVNMRRGLGISNDHMGLFINGFPDSHPVVVEEAAVVTAIPEKASGREGGCGGDESFIDWAAARALTKQLAECAVTFHNQPIGLLRYAPNVRAWVAAHIGQKRDCSYALSNIGAFTPICEDGQKDAANSGRSGASSYRIAKMAFTTPSSPIGGPFHFNVASVSGSSLVMAIKWQKGSLGVPDEKATVDELCRGLKDGFAKAVEGI